MSRQYLSAGRIIDENIKGNSLKTYCASLKQVGKVDYALALQTIKYKYVILQLLEVCNINIEQLDVQESVLLVMIYELLFGNGKIIGGGKVKRIVMEYSSKLIHALSEMMIGKSQHSELLSKHIQDHSKIGYYIRVNLVKLSLSEGLNYIQNSCSMAYIDSDIPSLISLPSTTNSFGQDPWVKEGKLIIQDKASCFPSQILYDEWLADNCCGDIIDACAAPGNKTSHIAALISSSSPSEMNNQHQNKETNIFAFDKSVKRSQLLQDRMKQMSIDNVKVLCGDFLEINIDDPLYKKVSGILLDPSCSGSGVVRSLERAVELKEDNNGCTSEEEKKRLLKLQSFQIQAIEKAMSFPKVTTIVYSTCSVHEEENEQVVANIIAKCADSNHSNGPSTNWKLVAPQRFINWKHRGNIIIRDGDSNGSASSSSYTTCLSEEQTQHLIRCSPDDGTNGFFVAVFKRNKVVINENDVSMLPNYYSTHTTSYSNHTSTTAVQSNELLSKSKRPLEKKKIENKLGGGANNNFCGNKLFKVQKRKK